MSLTSVLSAAKEAAMAAQNTLDSATKDVTAAQSAVDKFVPHLQAIGKIEAEYTSVTDDVAGRLKSAVGDLKGLLDL